MRGREPMPWLKTAEVAFALAQLSTADAPGAMVDGVAASVQCGIGFEHDLVTATTAGALVTHEVKFAYSNAVMRAVLDTDSEHKVGVCACTTTCIHPVSPGVRSHAFQTNCRVSMLYTGSAPYPAVTLAERVSDTNDMRASSTSSIRTPEPVQGAVPTLENEMVYSTVPSAATVATFAVLVICKIQLVGGGGGGGVTGVVPVQVTVPYGVTAVPV